MGKQPGRSATSVRDQGGRVQPGAKVSLIVTRGRIVIEPSSKIEYDLEKLVSGITTRNRHPEVSFGKAIGKEAL
jgi:antitoxin MazE